MDKFNINKYIFSSIPGMLLIGDKAETNRNKQISLFLKEIALYKILLKDLINYPPTEKQRNIILNISYYIAENSELIELITRKQDLPIRRLSKEIKMNEEFLKKWKEYILVYYIILSNPDYKGIQDYFRVEEKRTNLPNINVRKKANLYRGVAISTFKKRAYILTSSGEFINVKTNRETKVGQEISGQEKKGLRHYKLHISIMIFIMIIMGFTLYNKYCEVKTILIINTTSSIKLEVNCLDKVIYAYSSTEKGKKLLVSTEILNKNVDTAVQEVLEYSSNNKMIPLDNKILITINGEALKYGTLKKTSKFVNENNISVLINNRGNKHTLSPDLYE